MAKRTDVKRRVDALTTVGRHHDDHIDGCSLDFRKGAVTPDHELPAAKGGVEALKTPRGKKRKAGKPRQAAHR
jgi:hypothetical protein